MITLIQNLFRSPSATEMLEIKSRVQALEVQLREKDQRIETLRADLERERDQASGQTGERISLAQRQLLEAVASPLSQLLTQAHLSEQGKEIAGKDVLRLVKGLVRALEDEGLETGDPPGSKTKFDPNRHEPVSTATSPSPGDTVEVKFPRITFQGQTLRKAGISTVQS